MFYKIITYLSDFHVYNFRILWKKLLFLKSIFHLKFSQDIFKEMFTTFCKNASDITYRIYINKDF